MNNDIIWEISWAGELITNLVLACLLAGIVLIIIEILDEREK